MNNLPQNQQHLPQHQQHLPEHQQHRPQHQQHLPQHQQHLSEHQHHLPQHQHHLLQHQHHILQHKHQHQQHQHQNQNNQGHIHDFYNSFIADDKNQVWAAALTLAWKQFNLNIGQDIKINNNNLQYIVDKYNKCPFDSSCLQEKCYYVMCGPGQKTVDQINKQMKQKFPDSSMAPVTANLGPHGIISYAYLFKQLIFPVQFQKYSYKHLTFTDKNGSKKQVDSFYAQTKQQSHQILVHQYKNHDDFVVQIKNDTLKDKIYLVKHPLTLTTTVPSIIQKVTSIQHHDEPSIFRFRIDQFQMPIIDLNYSYSHKQLIGASIMNDNLKGFQFLQIMEGLKLKIDEKGVRCENIGCMFADECAFSASDRKSLKFDKPFWIVLKEQGHHPYLCVHINNL